MTWVAAGQIQRKWHNQNYSNKLAGDWIDTKEKIENKHQLAFCLVIEHTKQEITRLYAATTGVSTQISGVLLHDVFKMDAGALSANNVHYRTQVLHKDEPRDTQ